MNPIDPPDGTQKTALVIGAAGGIGGEVAHALIAHGWRVRGLARQPGRCEAPGGLGRAARVGRRRRDERGRCDSGGGGGGGDLSWRQSAEVPKLARPRDSDVAERHRGGGRKRRAADLSGSVYNFGPDAGSVIAEASPQHPLTRKGAVRVEMEAMLKAAANDGVRSLVLRAGDYFGPHQPNSWFRDAMVKPGAPLRSVTYPGDAEVGHAWAYLPDLAEAAARLAAIEASLPPFEALHFGGHWLPAWRRDGRGGPPGLRTAGFAHPPLSVGVDLCRRAVRDVFQRGDRDALPLAHSASARQCEACVLDRNGAAYAARCGAAPDLDGAWLSAWCAGRGAGWRRGRPRGLAMSREAFGREHREASVFLRPAASPSQLDFASVCGI